MKTLWLLLLLLPATLRAQFICNNVSNTNWARGEVVTVVTNVTETATDFEYYLPGVCPESGNGWFAGAVCAVYHRGPGVNPRGKIVTTTVKEVHTLNFEWRGKMRTQTDEVVLSETSQYFARETKTNWIDQAAPPRVYYSMTNGSGAMAITNLLTQEVWLLK